MKERKALLTRGQAKRIIIAYVQAFIAPYETAASDTMKFYFILILIVQRHPYADINALCDLDDLFEEFEGHNLKYGISL